MSFLLFLIIYNPKSIVTAAFSTTVTTLISIMAVTTGSAMQRGCMTGAARSPTMIHA
jgi:hypothetical protein